MQMFYCPQLKLDIIGFIWAFFLPQKYIVSKRKHWTNFSVQSATVVSKMLTTSSEYYCEPLVNSVYVTVATIIYL